VQVTAYEGPSAVASTVLMTPQLTPVAIRKCRRAPR
jgi:hypothetical protein